MNIDTIARLMARKIVVGRIMKERYSILKIREIHPHVGQQLVAAYNTNFLFDGMIKHMKK